MAVNGCQQLYINNELKEAKKLSELQSFEGSALHVTL